MAQFVCQCGDAVVAGLEVQQYIRMYAVHAPGIGAAAFAFVLVDIDPAFSHAFTQCLNIVLSQRLQRVFYGFAGFVKGAGKTFFAFQGQRHVEVVGMEFFITQKFLFQRNVIVERFQVLVYGVDETVVQADGDVFFRQAGFQRVFIAPCGRIEVTAAAGARERGGQRVPVTMVGVHEAGEGIFPQCAVVAGHVQHIAAFADGGVVSVAVLYDRKFHVGRDKGPESSGAGACGQLTVGQDRFLFSRQHVGAHSLQILQVKIIIGKGGIIYQLLQRFFR